MLVWLSYYLEALHHAFSVFHYVTLRAIFSALCALCITLWLGPYVIKHLIQTQVGQVIRELGPQSHQVKSGTPTMGGILVILSVLISCLLCGQLTNVYLWLVLGTMLSFGLIGFWDDYKKLVLKNSKGLSAKYKYLSQTLFGLLFVYILYSLSKSTEATTLYFPIFKNLALPLGGFFIIFAYFVVVGTSNAVNLTDGLDGLAIMPIVMVTGALGLLAYITGHHGFATYLHLPYIAGVEEICIFTAAVVGSGLGFLWFNAYPAQVFMGDVGSLSLGASMGIIAVISRQELLLFIMGGVFVVETLSVMLQVGSYKLTGKRIFKMAPIHHHFELSGWPEPRIIVRFWIITVILVLFSLASLKMR